MKENKPISRQEAISLLPKYWGVFIEATFRFEYADYKPSIETKIISIGWLIMSWLYGEELDGTKCTLLSFHFTGLRTMKEATKEEKDVLNSLGQYDVLTSELAYKAMSEKLDYLRKRGIATNNEHLFNYLIKD